MQRDHLGRAGWWFQRLLGGRRGGPLGLGGRGVIVEGADVGGITAQDAGRVAGGVAGRGMAQIHGAKVCPSAFGQWLEVLEGGRVARESWSVAGCK